MPVIPFSGGGLLPEGQYTVFATEVSPGESSGGHYQLTVDFQVADGPYTNRTFRQWLNAAMGSVDSLLGACGVDRDDDGNWVVDDAWEDVVGVLVTANVTHNTYQGNTNLRVNDFLPNDPIGARFEGTAAEDDQF